MQPTNLNQPQPENPPNQTAAGPPQTPSQFSWQQSPAQPSSQQQASAQTPPFSQSPNTTGTPPTTPPPPSPPPIRPPQRPPKKRINPTFRSFLSFFGFIASVVILATVINLFVFQSYYVDGTSMTPTLEPNERLIINKTPRTLARITGSHYIPKRGEIIVFNSNLISPTSGRHEQLIKRVIGLPGERVVVKKGKITIYNQAHPKGFNPDKALGLNLQSTDGDVDTVVPEGQIFVCGDNRIAGGSYDSRSDLGPVETDSIVGELLIRLIPLNKAEFF